MAEPQRCRMCPGLDGEGRPVLIQPDAATLPLSRGGTLPAVRWECRLCGAVRIEPERRPGAVG